MTGIMDTALDVLAETDPTGFAEALGIVFEETPTLRAGTDYHDGHLYMTVPIDRNVTVTVGKGKAAKEVQKRVKTTLCIRDDREFFLFDEEEVAKRNFTFPDTFVQVADGSRWSMDSVRRYIAGRTEPVDPVALYTHLVEVYKTHVEYPDDIYYELAPLYVMGSYVHRIFGSIAYLHFNGTAASGKSQNLRLISAFGLNAMWASNMSTSSMFRQIAGNPGVICLDEAENFEGERGQELRQILLSGYNNGSRATRAEKTTSDRFTVVQYDVFCPKVIASINTHDQVLTSRCVVIPMAPAIRVIPEFRKDDDRWSLIRDDLYVWAMQQANTIDQLAKHWSATKRYEVAPAIQSRQWEVAQLFLVLGDHVGGDALVTRLVEFFNRYFESAQKATATTDRVRQLLQVLPRVLATKSAHPGGFYAIKDIHEVMSGYLSEDEREYYKTKSVTRHLAALGFTDRRAARGGPQVHVDETFLREQFTRRRVDPFEEDADWLAGRRDYSTTEPEEPAPDDTTVHDDIWAALADYEPTD